MHLLYSASKFEAAVGDFQKMNDLAVDNESGHFGDWSYGYGTDWQKNGLAVAASWLGQLMSDQWYDLV